MVGLLSPSKLRFAKFGVFCLAFHFVGDILGLWPGAFGTRLGAEFWNRDFVVHFPLAVVAGPATAPNIQLAADTAAVKQPATRATALRTYFRTFAVYDKHSFPRYPHKSQAHFAKKSNRQ
jgi:hypothetical protein